MEVKTHPEVLTIQEAADFLRVSRSTLYKLVQAGKVPGKKVGRHWRFRKKTLENWLEQSL